jgi:hypothetical protein
MRWTVMQVKRREVADSQKKRPYPDRTGSVRCAWRSVKEVVTYKPD